jgi:glycosyltransferase involved in cell wall biosynthesis
MKILLATDAWAPQVNGVVRTLTSLVQELTAMGHQITVVHPGLFRGVACPGYAEIRLAIGTGRKVRRFIDEIEPDAIHIVTEGPIGMAARHWCLARGFAFTTAYHTRFPEYLAERYIAPARLTYAVLRRFHAPSRGVMVATESVRQELASRGFGNLKPWGRGVDATLFDPARREGILDFPRPIFLSVGRVAREKNLAAFLSLDLPGSKVVVGDGPQLAELQRRFPAAHFLGRHENTALAQLYAAADVFVFPSRTDTFGLVMLEALASGLPIAAFPVPGPLDVLDGSGAGVLDEDLRRAALGALEIPRERCREHALTFTWPACARQFITQLCPLH